MRRAHLPASAGQTRPSRARAGDARALGRRAHVREAARAEPRRADASRFIDGPITANNPTGVHHGLGPHAEGRLPALQGAARLRPALPERLRLARASGSRSRSRRRSGFNSKREIEEYGLAEFAARLPGASSRSSPAIDRAVEAARHVDGLGQRLLHVLRHEHRVHLALPQGGRTRAAGSTRATARRSGARAAARRSRSTSRPARRTTRSSSTRRSSSASRCGTATGESLVVWTTTPWTLPANVAAAVKPDAEYGRNDVGEWVAVERYPEEHFERAAARRRSSSGSEYDGPFDDLPAQEGVVHRVIPWDEVSLDEGTGIVHIAPGCGAEDFELSRVHDLPVLAPIDESRPLAARATAPFEGMSTDEVVEPVDRGAARARPARRGRHRSSTATRSAGAAGRRSSSASSTTGSSRADEIRQPMLDAQRDGRVDAAAIQEADGRLAAATWATGTSRASATSACRCRSTRASAGT